MIKERDLVPGRVIVRLGPQQSGPEPVVVEAFMVIGFQEQVKRRHAKSSAPRDGWHVLMIRFGPALTGHSVVCDVHITPEGFVRWKRLLF